MSGNRVGIIGIGQSAFRARRDDAANHPLIQAVLAAFPGAAIGVVRDLAATLIPDDGADSSVDFEMADPEMFVGDDDL